MSAVTCPLIRLPEWQDCHEMWSKLDRERKKKQNLVATQNLLNLTTSAIVMHDAAALSGNTTTRPRSDASVTLKPPISSSDTDADPSLSCPTSIALVREVEIQ